MKVSPHQDIVSQLKMKVATDVLVCFMRRIVGTNPWESQSGGEYSLIRFTAVTVRGTVWSSKLERVC